ncbi:MAG: 4-alpha-glucanotransferase [Clostridia bacterium]|nr:4-alpha-glucanotransferase [Clostridia bacterium]
MKRGILLPVFSLPNKYGIGSLGKEAYEFADFLAQTGNSYWQVLPLNPTSYGDSPYQSQSAYAGNPYFIDLDIIKEKGLLTETECAAEYSAANKIDYTALYNSRYKILEKSL